MPLPTPSKMISKRFKKPKTFIHPPLPTSSPSSDPSFSHLKLWPPPLLRKWRVRVICTDPDATDDSSDDELHPPPSPRKRSIREIFLPVPPSSLPQPTSMPESSSRPRRRRQNSNCNSIVPSKKLCCDTRDSEAILQDMDALFDAASETCSIGSGRPSLMHNWSMMLSDRECEPEEEEFARFLSEFVMDLGEKCMWEDRINGLAMPQEDAIADMLNLELDSEALTWINSLQRLP